MAVRTIREVDDFHFRRLDKPEEFRAVEEVHLAASAGLKDPAVPGALQRVVQDNGGLVVGALADIHLAGFTIGVLGWDGTLLYHLSLETAVRPEYQNHHVGFRLKAFQREEVLRQGLPEVRGYFDPLQSRTAMLLVRRLGARPHQYRVHYLGRLGTAEDEGGETDRVGYRWEISTPRVGERMEGKGPTPAEDEARWRESVPIVETEQGETGIRLPTSVTEPDAARAHLEIPFDLKLVRDHEAKSMRRWRHAVRDGFRSALDAGYQVDDVAVILAENERRSFYFFSRSPTPTPPTASPP